MSYYASTNRDGFQKYYNRLVTEEDWQEWAEYQADTVAVQLVENPLRRDFAEPKLVARLQRLDDRLLEPTTPKAMLDLVFDPDVFNFYKQVFTKKAFEASHPDFKMAHAVLKMYQTWHKEEPRVENARPLLNELADYKYPVIARDVARLQADLTQQTVLEQLMKTVLRHVFRVQPIEERLTELRAAQKKIISLEKQLQEARLAVAPARAAVDRHLQEQNTTVYRYLYEILNRDEMPKYSTFLHLMTDLQFDLVMETSPADQRETIAARVKHIKASRRFKVPVIWANSWRKHIQKLGTSLSIFQNDEALLRNFVDHLEYLFDATSNRIFDLETVRGMFGAQYPWETILQRLSEAVFMQFYQMQKIVQFAQMVQRRKISEWKILWEATTMMNQFQISNVPEYATIFFQRVRELLVQEQGLTRRVDVILELIEQQKQEHQEEKRARLECSVCFTPTNLVCSQCKTTHYCGPACQKKDAHQHACVKN